uniref:Bulb-type lectin domain-containing protein n=1 Tax=Quercus lobata TaxID=97700 RepID=A0A7N2MYD4_QUELO
MLKIMQGCRDLQLTRDWQAAKVGTRAKHAGELKSHASCCTTRQKSQAGQAISSQLELATQSSREGARELDLSDEPVPKAGIGLGPGPVWACAQGRHEAGPGIGSGLRRRRNYVAKDIKFGFLAWALCLMLKGVVELAVAVKVNMGPKTQFWTCDACDCVSWLIDLIQNPFWNDPINDSAGVLSIKQFGNLVLHDSFNCLLLSTNVSVQVTASSVAQLQDSRNLVLI